MPKMMCIFLLLTVNTYSSLTNEFHFGLYLKSLCMSFWCNWIFILEFSRERCLIIFGLFFFKNDHFRYRRCRRLDRSLTVCWQTLLQIAIWGLLQKQLLLSLLQSSFCLSATMKYFFTHNWLINWNIHFSAFLFVCLFLRKKEALFFIRMT